MSRVSRLVPRTPELNINTLLLPIIIVILIAALFSAAPTAEAQGADAPVLTPSSPRLSYSWNSNKRPVAGEWLRFGAEFFADGTSAVPAANDPTLKWLDESHGEYRAWNELYRAEVRLDIGANGGVDLVLPVDSFHEYAPGRWEIVTERWRATAGTHTAKVCVTRSDGTKKRCTGWNATEPSTTFVIASSANAGIWTDGTMLFNDGYPFVPQGIVFQHTLTSHKMRRACAERGITPLAPNAWAPFSDWAAVDWTPKEERICLRHIKAHNRFADTVTKAAMTGPGEWNANTIRLNINQGLVAAGHTPLTDLYLDEIAAKITTASNTPGIGAVILALFPGRNPGFGQLHDNNPNQWLDTQTTLDAATRLAEEFGDNRKVIIELLNEPVWTSYDQWANGAPGADVEEGSGVTPPVGVNSIIDQVHAVNPNTVVIVQGLQAPNPAGARVNSLADIPQLHVRDGQLRQVVYSTHPFLVLGDSAQGFYDSFADLAYSRPVVLTAWDAETTIVTSDNQVVIAPWCGMNHRLAEDTFMSVVRGARIGILAFAADVDSSATNFGTSSNPVVGLEKLKPSLNPNASCHPWHGSGTMLVDYFDG